MLQSPDADRRPMFRSGLILTAMFAIGMIGGSVLQARDADEGELVSLRRVYKDVDNNAEAGDLIEIGLNTDAFDGPFNLKVTIRGDGVKFHMKPIIVFAPRPRPDPNEPKRVGPRDEIRAYLTVEGAGDVALVVTPVYPPGGPKSEAIVFPIKIYKKGDLKFPPVKP
jgi:hypothetical protein